MNLNTKAPTKNDKEYQLNSGCIQSIKKRIIKRKLELEEYSSVLKIGSNKLIPLGSALLPKKVTTPFRFCPGLLNNIKAKQVKHDILPQDYLITIKLLMSCAGYRKYQASLCLSYFKNKAEFHPEICILNKQERNFYNTLNNEKRKTSYLLGRIAAKQSIKTLLNLEKNPDIYIETGLLGHPVVRYKNHQNIQLSITHCNNITAAVAFPYSSPIAIDMESIKDNIKNISDVFISNDELSDLRTTSLNSIQKLTLLWTSKEALSKLLKTGLSVPFNVLKISKIKVKDNYYICEFEKFCHFVTISIITKNISFSFALPKKVELEIDLEQLKNSIEKIQSI